jgi:aminopeptidase
MTAHQRNVSASIDPVKLDRLAEVAVKVGLQLQPGQDLLLTAPSVALPLVRRIAEHAYKAGAGIVTPFLSDEEITLSRYRYGHNESFDRAAGWLYEGMAKAFTANTARLAIVGDNPMLLSGEDPVMWRAPARPIRSPISRRWRRSSISKPTGTSSPIRARPGRSRFSPMFRRMWR